MRGISTRGAGFIDNNVWGALAYRYQHGMSLWSYDEHIELFYYGQKHDAGVLEHFTAFLPSARDLIMGLAVLGLHDDNDWNHMYMFRYISVWPPLTSVPAESPATLPLALQ
jgi:hypothetical protein